MLCPLMSRCVTQSPEGHIGGVIASFEEVECKEGMCAWWNIDKCIIFEIARKVK